MFRITAVGEFETHILYPVTFLPENGAFYEKMWENIVERDRP